MSVLVTAFNDTKTILGNSRLEFERCYKLYQAIRSGDVEAILKGWAANEEDRGQAAVSEIIAIFWLNNLLGPWHWQAQGQEAPVIQPTNATKAEVERIKG